MSVITQLQRDLLEVTAFETIQASAARMQKYALADDSDPELVLKIVNSKLADIGKTVPDRKIDQYANLPIFNITFVNGAMRGSIEMAANTPPADLENLPVLETSMPEISWVPSRSMLAYTSINRDIGGLLDD